MIISKYLTPILTRICNKIWYLSNIFPNSLKEIVEKERIKLRKVNKGGETMKKLLTVLAGVVIALSLFVTTGNTVKAAEQDEDCTCHDLLPLQGAERNKIVAKFLSSEEFKAKKLELITSGSTWKGAHTIEVVLPAEGVTMVGVPFINVDGIPEVYVFINGTFAGTASAE